MKPFEFVAFPAQEVPAALAGLAKTIFEQFGKQDLKIQEFTVIDQWVPGQLVGQASHTCWAIALLTPDVMGNFSMNEYTELVERSNEFLKQQSAQDANGLRPAVDEYGLTQQQQACVHDFIEQKVIGGPQEWACIRCGLPLSTYQKIEREG